MATDYDNQLIESVDVRRKRLITALLFGINPHQRRWMDIGAKLMLSVAFAAGIAAVCVGYSFVSNLLHQQAEQQKQQQQQQRVQPSSQAPLPDTYTGTYALSSSTSSVLSPIIPSIASTGA